MKHPQVLDDHSDDESGTQTGQGGQTGAIEFRFHDFMQLPPRDDALPPQELKRLLIMHKELHKSLVKKQKEKRRTRANQKDNKFTQNYSLQNGFGGGRSKFKAHPLKDKAQFSGIEEVLPADFNADTNPEMQDKLENRNELKHRLTNQPKYTSPRPRAPGG